MKKTAIICTIAILCVALLIFILLRVTMYDCFCARKLIKAIENDDVDLVEEIISENSKAINTLPSIASKGWQSAMNTHVLYPLAAA